MDVIKGIILLILNNPRLFILFILCILIEIYYPKIRGFFGEFWVKLELKRLPKDKFIILNDIMIKDDNGTHQIDHLVLSEFGIFVIEMKNYYGGIAGNENQEYWFEYIKKKRYKFDNPIITFSQNQKISLSNKISNKPLQYIPKKTSEGL